MSRRIRKNLRLIGAALLLGALPATARAQAPSSNLGLTALGGAGVYAGSGWMERHGRGEEGGFLVDVGWLRGRSVRLQAELGLLHAGLTEYFLVDDETYSGDYWDLTGSLVAIVLLGGPDRRVAPYVLGGVGVHALSSQLSQSVLVQRYNANRFGSQVGAGMRFRLGDSGRRGAFIELRRVIADEVMRTVFRAGALLFLGDLAPGGGGQTPPPR